MDAVKTLESTDEGKTFSVPESSIGSARDARDTISVLLRGEDTRATRRARVNGMWNGNPPWPALLRDKGAADRANFTLREFEGFVAQAKTPYYALAFKTDPCCTFTIDYGGGDPAFLAECARKIALRYHYLNDDDDTFDSHMQRSQVQMVVHGSGPMVFEDYEEGDWRAYSCKTGDIMVPDDASAEINEWDTAVRLRSFLPSELYRKIQNAGDKYWNKQAVKKAIMEASSDDARNSYGDNWNNYETQIRKGATGFDARSKRIFVYELLQREFTGKISHFMLVREEEKDPAPAPSDQDKDPMHGFLFRRIGRYENWSQKICPFPYDVGPDMDWHSIKGAGPKIFDYCAAGDRLFCKSLDGAMKAAGIIVKAMNGNALQTSAFTDVGGGTVVSPDHDVVKERVAPDLEGPMLMKDKLGQTLSRNTGQYRAHFANEEHAPTLGQEQMTAADQNELADGDATRYYKYLDRFHRERFRRVLAMGKKLYARHKQKLAPGSTKEPDLTESEKGALKFFKGCIEDGVPELMLDFKLFCRIKATRLVGNGSKQMQMVVGEKLLGILPMTPERGRNVILRNHISTVAGPAMADAIVPPYDTPQLADSHISVATLENNFLRLPDAQVRIDPANDHVVHFQIHGQDIGKHSQQVEAGQADPHALLLHLEQAGPHMGEHLTALAGDPSRKEQLEQMNQQWMDLSKMADKLRQNVEAMDAAAEQEQEQPPIDPAILKVLGELSLKEKKQSGELALKAQKQAFSLREKDIKTAHTIRTTNLKTVSDINATKAKAVAAAKQPAEKAA